jgi:hypothetical protein
MMSVRTGVGDVVSIWAMARSAGWAAHYELESIVDEIEAKFAPGRVHWPSTVREAGGGSRTYDFNPVLILAGVIGAIFLIGFVMWTVLDAVKGQGGR